MKKNIEELYIIRPDDEEYDKQYWSSKKSLVSKGWVETARNNW